MSPKAPRFKDPGLFCTVFELNSWTSITRLQIEELESSDPVYSWDIIHNENLNHETIDHNENLQNSEDQQTVYLLWCQRDPKIPSSSKRLFWSVKSEKFPLAYYLGCRIKLGVETNVLTLLISSKAPWLSKINSWKMRTWEWFGVHLVQALIIKKKKRILSNIMVEI